MTDRAVTPTGCPRPREAVLKMAPYSPPTANREGKLRLDFNENTIGCSPRVVEFLRERLSADALSVYPEYQEAKKALAAFFSVEPDQFILTNGTDEAIQLIVNTYVDGGDEVLLLRPSYAMYRFYSELAGASVVEIDYESKDLSFPLEGLLEAIHAGTKAILIANPNNPTGTAVPPGGIEKILERAAGAAVLIDEAYYDFYGTTVMEFIPQAPNLFVSRTFSKAYGMAAMRLGCVFSQAENIAHLHKTHSPYSVNMLAALAVREAIKDREYTQNYAAEVIAARQQLYEGLEAMSVPYYRSQANFVLIQVGSRAVEIRDRLRQMGVLVRDRSYELPGCVRITVGTRQQVGRFLEAFREVW